MHESCGLLAAIILVGNKSDLSEQREVTTETGQEYAERYGAGHFSLADLLLLTAPHLVPDLS